MTNPATSDVVITFSCSFSTNKDLCYKGGSPGQVVMGGDSCSESWHRILDGHFSHIFVAQIVMCV